MILWIFILIPSVVNQKELILSKKVNTTCLSKKIS